MTAYASVGAMTSTPVVTPVAQTVTPTPNATPAPNPTTAQLKAWVFARLEKEGISTSIADRVITCESGWHPGAKHLNLNGTWDIGLWQINDVNGMNVQDRLDPYKSTERAILLIKARGWQPWVCFTKSYPQAPIE